MLRLKDVALDYDGRPDALLPLEYPARRVTTVAAATAIIKSRFTNFSLVRCCRAYRR